MYPIQCVNIYELLGLLSNCQEVFVIDGNGNRLLIHSLHNYSFLV